MLLSFPAYALDDCYKQSVGAWNGPVMSDGIKNMDTEFTLDAEGSLTGRYHIHGKTDYDGTLTKFEPTGTCGAIFAWTDRHGSGKVIIQFYPAQGRFTGVWGIGEAPAYIFDGHRIASTS